MPDHALRDLGAFLTGTEAAVLAARFADGDTLTAALGSIGASRRDQVRHLLREAGLGPATRERTCEVLRAIEGARSDVRDLATVWTMPGHLSQAGPLTTSAAHLVDGARTSVMCSTYNFQRTSALWPALQDAARRPGLAVTVYLDTAAGRKGSRTPSPEEVAVHLRPARVLRTKPFGGSLVRNHAKFLVVDHRFLLISSANFSRSAEYENVELGVRVDDVALAESVEREMQRVEGVLYEPAG
ncbi:DISARM system phospholipase D-like protein DrmC [Kineosporia sp. J2-2]|uniref:phospholipase D n=1 Tax=Kineosporia corallincola TaxID=2835133 RepID=A0ABS5TU19_9ACTN|nr:DISARM system phospholipase D-like protein DrmC [Kineosporia corallincola]MBT0774291.1 DISARM system phospholipase D-like protein DrmC [Kineosporia corallincola]